MKNQYCGDINDYYKYGLLRVLSKKSFRLGVCWMLTPDDGRNDGSRRKYLEKPGRISAYDPELFDQMPRIRSVAAVEDARLISGATYWRDEVPRSTTERTAWLEKMCESFAKTEIVFFDPDNGLEVKSKPWKTTASPKHLYWREVAKVWAGGQSVVIYQHFPREPRNKFVKEMKDRLKKKTNCSSVFALCTSHVVFLIAAHEHHHKHLRDRLEQARDAFNKLGMKFDCNEI
jgi:hypothetical protein